MKFSFFVEQIDQGLTELLSGSLRFIWISGLSSLKRPYNVEAKRLVLKKLNLVLGGMIMGEFCTSLLKQF